MDTNTTGTAGTSTTASPSSGVKQELASDAKTIGAAARGKVEEQAAAGKEQATQAARSTSSALNKAVVALREDNDTPQWLTKGFEKAARELDKLAGDFEGKDMRAIASDVTAFARRNPAAFLAASAAVGFLAARFLRAGSDYGAHQAGEGGSSSQRLAGQGGGSYPGYGSNQTGGRSSFAFDDDTGSGSGSSMSTNAGYGSGMSSGSGGSGSGGSGLGGTGGSGGTSGGASGGSTYQGTGQ